MRVSLIVCTRNRAGRLADFLHRLATLASPPGGWELILVDNGSTDGTAEAIQSFAGRAAFPLRSVRAERPGLARARNVGLEHAGGRILAFTDDDCYPHPDYLCALVSVFDEVRAGVIGGRVVLHDPADARVGVKETLEPLDMPPRTFVRPGIVHGANMAALREVVHEIGGFDPLLGAGTRCMAGEDTDFVARAVWAGWKGRYDPRPVVAHHHGRKPGAASERQKQGYDRGRGAYYAKYVLDSRSRRLYLGHWYHETRSAFRRPGAVGRFRRELTGASFYVVDRVVRSGDRDGFKRPMPIDDDAAT
jgi:glycosyltransferase involved in cell wall biosynthesis